MGRIIVSENVSLDGIAADPTGEDGSRHGGWFEQYMAGDREAWAEVEFQESLDATVMLIGRRTDAYFGPRWTPRTTPWADRLNSMPKYVVSSTIATPAWTNATVLTGDVVEEVTRLKSATDGDIIVVGSLRLAQTLLEHGLVDELRLIVFPVVLGDGDRFFGRTPDKTSLRLLAARPLGEGLAYLAYDVVRD